MNCPNCGLGKQDSTHFLCGTSFMEEVDSTYSHITPSCIIIKDLNARIKQLEDELSESYLEMVKVYPCIKAVFKIEVWDKAKEAIKP